MIAEKILSEITPESIKEEVEKIKAAKLPPKLEECVREYEKAGERDRFSWKALYAFAPYGSLPGVIEKYQKSVFEIKVILIIFVTLADDLADKYKDKELLNKISAIPFNKNFEIDKKIPRSKQNYLKSGQKIWSIFEKEIKKYPYYYKFEEYIKFDFQQVINAIKFSYLLNEAPQILYSSESKNFLSYNMQVFVNSDIDIMCISDFDMDEFGILREIVGKYQIMARIGNCLGTWERELEENDFSSFVFIYAIKNNIIALEELKSKDKIKIKNKISTSNCQKYLLNKWERNYNEIKNLVPMIKSIDFRQYLKNSEKILKMHIIGKKHW
ncbi:MAG: hypothetical protein V1732_06335 [Patescibacteria group bacterium]